MILSLFTCISYFVELFEYDLNSTHVAALIFVVFFPPHIEKERRNVYLYFSLNSILFLFNTKRLKRIFVLHVEFLVPALV